MPELNIPKGAETERYYVRIPERNVTEINEYIKESGMYQAHFLSNALVVGARETAPQRPKSRIAQAVAGERRRSMRQALGQLAPEQRQLLELSYFEGLSQVEIAVRLNQPLGIVEVRMKMAVRNLATLLSSSGLLTT